MINDLNRLRNNPYEQEKPVHVSARFSGELAAIWKDLETRFSTQSPSDLLKECVRLRAVIAEIQRRTQAGESAKLTITVKETDNRPEDFLEFMAISWPAQTVTNEEGLAKTAKHQ